MERINKTSLILGIVWVVGSYLLVTQVFSDWFYARPIWVIPVTIIGGVVIIRILFDMILKYDFFNKDYKKQERRK
jgi:peptidoglycan biosynthesis protein MviN/MurJ (putative lipid II flippase)